MAFGDLRSLLQRPAGPDTWQALCAFLDLHATRRSSDAAWEQLIQYARSVLKRWDPALCLAPDHWVAQLFAGKSPLQMLAARRLSTLAMDIGDEQIFEMTASPLIANITYLEMGFPYRVAWRPERLDYGCVRELVTCPHLRQLSRLTITGQHLLPDSFSSILSKSNQFIDLQYVDLSHNDLNFLRPQDLPRGETELHTLTSLLLNNVNLNRQGLSALAHLNLAELVRLELTGNHHHLEDTDLLCLHHQGRWSMPQLEHLALSQCQEDGSAFFEIFSSLQAPNLRHLSLHFTSRTERPRQIITMLSGLPIVRRLEKLELDNLKLVHLDSEQLTHFFRAEHAPNLRHLSLFQTGLHMAHIPWLLSWFDEGGALETLDCSANPVRIEWLEALVAAIEVRPALHAPRTILLHDTVLDPGEEEVQQRVARAARHNFTLDVASPRHPHGDSLYPEDELDWEES